MSIKTEICPVCCERWDGPCFTLSKIPRERLSKHTKKGRVIVPVSVGNDRWIELMQAKGNVIE